jgi:hypothetical protein
VTVGSCESDFVSMVRVYTGTALNALTSVTGGNDSEGPHCPFGGREYTFQATSGVEYRIVVDGNAFYLPEMAPPDTEGTFKLRIEATPPPPNNDFVNATVLAGRTSEEPRGTRHHWATGRGYNWGASKETGEPDHAGDPGGASVWYSWTAPESGVARVSACCGPFLLGFYTGGSVDALVPVDPTPEPPVGHVFSVEAGKSYRIAVDGQLDTGAGAAEMGSFYVHLGMMLSPRATVQSTVVGSDLIPPNTAIQKRVLKRRPPIVIFGFTAGERGSTFRCKLDRNPFVPCKSPKTYRNLKFGQHVFRVVALDPAGNMDPSPAVSRFQVVKPKRKPKYRRQPLGTTSTVPRISGWISQK